MKHAVLSVLLISTLMACGGSTFVVVDGGDVDGGAGGSGGSGNDASVKPDANPDLYACDGTFGSCVLTGPGCCGIGCGMEPVVVAVGRNQTEVYREATCDTKGPVACPGCASIPNPNVHAACRNRTCEVVDVRTSELSACQTDLDCQLAYGAACCARCEPPTIYELVAINRRRTSDFRSLVCAGTEACPRCASDWSSFGAVCDVSTKHCKVLQKK